jgi:Flp pilus assembly CpaF family ATPase
MYQLLYGPLDLICGGTGSGKTNLLMNLIFNYLYYNKIYIYAKDMTEVSYLNLQDFFEKDNKTIKKILVKTIK